MRFPTPADPLEGPEPGGDCTSTNLRHQKEHRRIPEAPSIERLRGPGGRKGVEHGHPHHHEEPSSNSRPRPAPRGHIGRWDKQPEDETARPRAESDELFNQYRARRGIGPWKRKTWTPSTDRHQREHPQGLASAGPPFLRPGHCAENTFRAILRPAESAVLGKPAWLSQISDA
jgi:hypothetical protein